MATKKRSTPPAFVERTPGKDYDTFVCHGKDGDVTFKARYIVGDFDDYQNFQYADGECEGEGHSYVIAVAFSVAVTKGGEIVVFVYGPIVPVITRVLTYADLDEMRNAKDDDGHHRYPASLIAAIATCLHAEAAAHLRKEAAAQIAHADALDAETNMLLATGQLREEGDLPF
jgi:hypothetical protein